jgi:hydroxymethylglutaryl-CoA lyase
MSVAEAVSSSGAIASAVGGRVPIDVVVSCAFGSPYEGEIDPLSIANLCAQLLAGGSTRITLADTTGMATPVRIQRVLEALSSHARQDLGLHLHETRGTALVNAYSAMQLGIGRFDTSIGGLGGSPFAAGAAGNLATEDLVYLCDDLGVTTGIDLARLLLVSAQTALDLGHAVPSRVAAAGPRVAASLEGSL